MNEPFYQLYKSLRELGEIEITDSIDEHVKEFIRATLLSCEHYDLSELKYLERYLKEKEIK